MMKQLFFIVCILALTWNTVNAQVAATNCTALGIDFSPLSNYLISYTTSNNWTFVMKMCNNVNEDALCYADTTSRDSMICQRRDYSANAYRLATYTPSQMFFTATRAGMSMQFASGEDQNCGRNRFVQVNFICDAAATTPRMSYAGETSTCRYQIDVRTNVVCRDANFCNFNGVDMINMFGQGDLTYSTSSHTYYFHMCSPDGVQNPYCRSDSTANNSMLCQARTSLTDAFALARWVPQDMTWAPLSTLDSGFQLYVANGEWCASHNINRTTRINFICDRNLNLTYSYISGLVEVNCVYEMTVHTRLVCSDVTASTGINWSSSSSWFPDPVTADNCKYAPFNYDFRPLYNAPDLSWTGFVGNSYYNVFFHMCGSVRDVNCLNDSTTYNSMVCQQRYTDFTGNFAVAHFLPNSPSTRWFPSRYGVVYQTLDNGERCGSSNYGRTSNIEFRCNPSAYPGTITGFTETQTCVYLMTVETSLVCNGTNAVPVYSSSTGFDPRTNCIYDGALDMTRINPADGSDLAYVAFYNNRTYNIYMRLCERVANRACRADTTATNTMICQRRADGSDSFNLASYNTADMAWTTLRNAETGAYNGLRLRVTGGESCGSTNRASTVVFRCVENAGFGRNAVITNFTEPSTCQYEMEVVANDVMCSFLFAKNNPDANSGSSGLSGGMIALIVIVIIVGIAAIIAAIAAWKFYGSPFAFMHQKGEKDIEMQNENHNNTSYEHEESTTGENI